MKRIDFEAVEKAKADAAFSEHAWLTFYVFGDPWRHEALKPALQALGARNLGGAEGGMVYAKLPVTLEAGAIGRSISEVRHLVSEAGLEIHVIDVDSCEDVKRSKLYTLWTAG